MLSGEMAICSPEKWHLEITIIIIIFYILLFTATKHKLDVNKAQLIYAT